MTTCINSTWLDVTTSSPRSLQLQASTVHMSNKTILYSIHSSAVHVALITLATPKTLMTVDLITCCCKNQEWSSTIAPNRACRPPKKKKDKNSNKVQCQIQSPHPQSYGKRKNSQILPKCKALQQYGKKTKKREAPLSRTCHITTAPS